MSLKSPLSLSTLEFPTTTSSEASQSESSKSSMVMKDSKISSFWSIISLPQDLYTSQNLQKKNNCGNHPGTLSKFYTFPFPLSYPQQYRTLAQSIFHLTLKFFFQLQNLILQLFLTDFLESSNLQSFPEARSALEDRRWIFSSTFFWTFSTFNV